MDSTDPNGLMGPAGFGPQNFTSGDQELPYQIDFENDPHATAPAQRVVISNRLDRNLDLTTFRLTEIAFGDTALLVPPGSQHFQTVVSMTYNGETFDVLVEAGLNTDTRTVQATFQSLDPKVDLPPDALTGFLPPEDGTGRGSGHVSYSIKPVQGLPTGTEIRNTATVVFDVNPPISTDQVSESDPSLGVDPNKQALVTLDTKAPTSKVTALPATETSAEFTLNWSGTDDTGGSGIAFYDIYVSVDGAPSTSFQNHSTATSASFVGSGGHQYAFYSVATDNVGNVEVAPAVPRYHDERACSRRF